MGQINIIMCTVLFWQRKTLLSFAMESFSSKFLDVSEYINTYYNGNHCVLKISKQIQPKPC